MSEIQIEKEILHYHVFCGLGGGAKGFNKGHARVGSSVAKFRCIGGVDVDAASIRDFDRLAGVPGTVLDMFDLEQYIAFHGKAPPPGWRMAGVEDIHKSAGGERPNIVFLSAPCKGFSGLLAEKQSKTDKYQALNGLTLRGMMLVMEAFKDDPPEMVIFENVPRIANRGRYLVDQIMGMMRGYGYAGAETVHDCGVIGNLAQSRSRFLAVFRHMEKVPPFLYEPPKRRLRGVGEVLDLMPLPGDPRGGPMHRVPALQWKTWVRLAFVEAGKDWRSLNSLRVEDGFLQDYAIAPDTSWRDGTLGVLPYDSSAGTITAQAEATTGRFSVADPKTVNALEGSGHMGVRAWQEPSGAISGDARPSKGPYGVADPRTDMWGAGQAGVSKWDEPGPTVTSARSPLQNRGAVADPRPGQGNQTFGQYGVRPWEQTAGVVTAQSLPGGGPNSVADPRFGERTPFNNVFRIVPWEGAAPAVAGPGGPAGGLGVADPRMPDQAYTKTKYQVTPYEGFSRTVIGASTTGEGAFALADPRVEGRRNGALGVLEYDDNSGVVGGESLPPNGTYAVADPRTGYPPNTHTNKLKVISYEERSPAVIGSDRVGSGALSVADPRPAALSRPDRDGYMTQGHYGVLGWDDTAGAVPAFAKNNNGHWSIADRRVDLLPGLAEQLTCVIIARDGTWHRPFTTLELAALQSLYDPEEGLKLDGKSDSAWRERIGNAVPPDAAAAVASVMGKTLLLAWAGESFMLSSEPIWVQPLAIALSVDTSHQVPA